jgi:TPR repeat protein
VIAKLNALCVVLGAALVSCRARVPDPPARDVDPKRKLLELVARADEALAAGQQLDYQRPMEGRPYNPAKAHALYTEACKGGHKRSCWIALSLTRWVSSAEDEARGLVRANCIAGHRYSCRGLANRFSLETTSEVPGWAGRSQGCPYYPERECDLVTLRHECLEGFAVSCDMLQSALSSMTEDGRAAGARALILAREGCRVGLTRECDVLSLLGDHADQLAAHENLCPLEINTCNILGALYLEQGEPLRARDAFERACQYARVRGICLLLAQAYLDGDLIEPVPGRGQALRTWGCDDPASTKNPLCQERTAPPEQSKSP